MKTHTSNLGLSGNRFTKFVYPCLFLFAALTIFSAGSLSAEGKHLFILSGQSNMVGMKPELTFTPAVTEAFGAENVTVVKEAQNGALISRWYLDYQYPDGRKVSTKEQEKFGIVYKRLWAALEAETAGKSYDTVTFIWMQGESDARESLADVYAQSFKGILQQLKDDLAIDSIHFVLGRISDFGIGHERYPHWTRIREIQVELAEESPKGDWVDTDEFNGGKPGVSFGGLHYSARGYKQLGQRFADKAIALINNL